MKTIEAESVFLAAVAAHMRVHNERPFCVRIGRGLAHALITPDGTQTFLLSDIFREKGVDAFAEEIFCGYPVNVDMEGDYEIRALTKTDWDNGR